MAVNKGEHAESIAVQGDAAAHLLLAEGSVSLCLQLQVTKVPPHALQTVSCAAAIVQGLLNSRLGRGYQR